jgi:hypothetical protein
MIITYCLFIFSILSIYVCYSVAKGKKANVRFWVLMGVLLGPLAVPFVFFAKPPNDKNVS